MADIVSSEQRSRNMAAIRSKDTGPEVFFRKLLFAEGFRYRTQEKSVPVHPDIFLRKYNAAVFVHGCYWHRHSGCKYAYLPKSRVEFWEKKFSDNLQRDAIVKEELSKQKIRQLIVWECTIKNMQRNQEITDTIIEQSVQFLLSDLTYLEL